MKMNDDHLLELGTCFFFTAMLIRRSAAQLRLSTAGDLVASAAEGPERLKTELKLYRQQLEQAGCLTRV